MTPLRLAERQRDEALRFLSHDARAACATIIGMVELARASSAALDNDPLLSRIEREARAGLSRCDGFLALARAEAQPLRFEALDLVSLLQQSIDQAWPLARERQVRIRVDVLARRRTLRGRQGPAGTRAPGLARASARALCAGRGSALRCRRRRRALVRLLRLKFHEATDEIPL